MIEIPKKEPLNIVPFIDIMLVLLAMVLSISTFIAKGEIEINLPKSNEAAAPSSVATERVRRIQVDAAGTYYFDGDAVSAAALPELIRTLKPEERVLLRIDKNSAFERFIEIIDVLKKENHENFSIETEKTG